MGQILCKFNVPPKEQRLKSDNKNPDALTVITYLGDDAEDGSDVPATDLMSVRKLFPKLNSRLVRFDRECIRIDVTVPVDITEKARDALRSIIIETAI